MSSKCKVSVGAVPCFRVAFWEESDEMGMFDLLTGIYDQIGNRCNSKFHAQAGFGKYIPLYEKKKLSDIYLSLSADFLTPGQAE